MDGSNASFAVSEIDDTAIVASCADMARLLLTASPGRAAAFALAAHERACWEVDGSRAAFWQSVLRRLDAPAGGEAEALPAAPRVRPHDPWEDVDVARRARGPIVARWMALALGGPGRLCRRLIGSLRSELRQRRRRRLEQAYLDAADWRMRIELLAHRGDDADPATPGREV